MLDMYVNEEYKLISQCQQDVFIVADVIVSKSKDTCPARQTTNIYFLRQPQVVELTRNM